MKKPKIIIIIIITVVISGLLFFLYCQSKISSIKGLRSSIEKLQQNMIGPSKEETSVIKYLRQLFPERPLITGFIEDTYRISVRRKIRNLIFEQKNREFIELASGRVLMALPTLGKKPQILYSYPVKISFNSNYRNMAEFIREIQNLERLVTIKSLKVSRDNGKLSVEMVVNIYSTKEG